MFYRKLVKYIEAYLLQISPYNPCGANNIINRKQMRVVRHGVNLKVSHVNSFEITKVEGYLSSIHGGLPVHGRKIQDYLVMDLDHVKQGKLKSFMIKYLYSVLQELPEHLVTTTATPRADHLIKVCDEG